MGIPARRLKKGAAVLLGGLVVWAAPGTRCYEALAQELVSPAAAESPLGGAAPSVLGAGALSAGVRPGLGGVSLGLRLTGPGLSAGGSPIVERTASAGAANHPVSPALPSPASLAAVSGGPSDSAAPASRGPRTAQRGAAIAPEPVALPAGPGGSRKGAEGSARTGIGPASRFAEMVRSLALPSAVGRLPQGAGTEELRRTGGADFRTHLGVGADVDEVRTEAAAEGVSREAVSVPRVGSASSLAVLRADTAPRPEESGGSAGRTRPSRSRASGMDVRPEPRPDAVVSGPAAGGSGTAIRRHRSPFFSSALALALGGLAAMTHGFGAAVHAAGASAAVGAISALSTVAMVAAAPAVLYAALELGSFAFVMLRGRGVTDREFWRGAKDQLSTMGLHPGVAASLLGTAPGRGMLKPYQPRRFSFTFGFTAGPSIYLRPELIRAPWLFRLVLKHELAHYFSDRARGPPKTGRSSRPGLLWRFWTELHSRASDFRGAKWLQSLKLPAPERVLKEAGISLRLSEPFDLLVVRPAASEWEDSALYERLSDGRARVSVLDGGAGALEDRLAETGEDGEARLKPRRAGRYRALVASGDVLKVPNLPEPASEEFRSAPAEVKKLVLAFKQLDRIHRMAQLLERTEGEGVIPAALPDKELAGIAEYTRSRRRSGEFDADRLERMLSDMWHHAVATYLRDIRYVRTVEAVYAALEDRGTALLPWPEDARGLATMQKLLRYWRAADGGRFAVERVDLPEGGHALIATKLEARVTLWLAPAEGRELPVSYTNVSADAAAPHNAGALLAEAGFTSKQIAKFKADGVEVRHVFGKDVGMNHVYVSVPRARARALRRFAQREGIETQPSRGGFELHLLQSGPMQNLPGAYKLGFRGEGESIYDIDTGIDDTHPDFAGDPPGEDDIVKDGHGDFVGHGTHKASISYAHGTLYIGMAPKARGRMGKVFSRDGGGASDGDIMAAAAEAMKWGADVISLSLGSPGETGSPLSVFFSDLTRRKNSKGRLPVVTASGGNSGPFPFSISQPGSGEEVDTSAASAKSLDDGVPEISFFSSVGPAVDERWPIPRLADKPDDAPLGGDVTTPPGVKDVYKFGIEAAKSKDMPKTPSDTADGLHTRMSGTSMSNPMNAGIDALIDQAVRSAVRPGSEAEKFYEENRAFAVRMIRLRTDRDMGVPTWYQGKGFPDAEAAVRMAVASFGSKPGGLASRAKTVVRLKSRALAAAAGGEGFDWIKRAKAVHDLELGAYQASLDAAKAAGDNKARANSAAQKAFNTARDKALPDMLKALKDPVWLVRRTAAFSLMNFQAPAAVQRSKNASVDQAYLAEVAAGDSDARVRQMAFIAIAETPTRAADPFLRELAPAPQPALSPAGGEGRGEGVPIDVSMYAAYALAAHGDVSALDRIAAGTKHADKWTRFTAVWLLGQAGAAGAAEASDRLAEVLSDEAERGNIRHLTVPSLAVIALSNPDALGDAAIVSLLANAGTQNLALTRTISKFFPAAAQRRELVARLRSEPLRTTVTRFVLANKSAADRPGALGEMVTLLARILNIPLEAPSPTPSPDGVGVPGVDPDLGPIQMIVEVPSVKARIGKFEDYRAQSARVSGEAMSGLGLDPQTMARHEAVLQTAMPLSNSVWVNVPEYKVRAFTAELEAQGYKVHPARPVYRLIHETGPLSGMTGLRETEGLDGKGVLVLYVDEGGNTSHPGIDPSRIRYKYNATDEGGPEETDQESIGHGTHGMGIVGAQSFDGSPYVGMAPGVDYAIIKVLGAGGGTDAQVMAGLEKAASLVGDPLKTPAIINMSLGGPGTPDSPLSRLVTKIVLKNIGVIAAAGNEGPRQDTIGSPANAPLAVAIGAVDKAKKLTFYSSRSTPDKREVRRVNFGGGVDFNLPNPYEIVSLLTTTLADAMKDAATTLLYKGKALFQYMSGTSMAAPHETGMQSALIAEMAKVLLPKFGAMPDGYWLWLNDLLDKTAETMPAYKFHEVGFGRTDPKAAWTSLREALKDPDKIKSEAEAMARSAREKYGDFPAPRPKPAWVRLLSAVGRLFARPAKASAAYLFDPSIIEEAARRAADGALRRGSAGAPGRREAAAGAMTRGGAGASGEGTGSGRAPEIRKRLSSLGESEPDRAALKELKRVLADGTDQGGGTKLEPFSFRTSDGAWFKARSAGLEGFYYSKLEVERDHGILTGQLEDFFRYLGALVPAGREYEQLREELSTLRSAAMSAEAKSAGLNAVLAGALRRLHARIRDRDPSLAGRNASTYMILARAYNRLRPGANFFDSLDAEEFARIRAENPGVNELWPLDVFEIGDARRWGTAGGSPYAIKGYRIKEELGGEAAFKRFVERAHAAGFKVKLDFIPNHASLDSEMLAQAPESFLHIVPPQPAPGEAFEAYRRRILREVPREPQGNRSPAYYLAETDQYPENDRRVHKWILVHHPMTDYGETMWVDMAQIDYTRSEARAWQSREMTRLFTDWGVDSVRRDMAYEDLMSRFVPRWTHILARERGEANGWTRDELGRLVSGFDARASALRGSEFLEEATDKVKAAKPGAYMIDEAYANASDLSRTGSDGVYNKADFDKSMGQVGLYDAQQSGDVGRLEEALENVAFRRWQQGGAATVQFIGTHDGGEGNPYDKFGRLVRAVMATALLFRPILSYNGVELGVGQRDMLLGDLSRSVDREKSIPFDVPVRINWRVAPSADAEFRKKALAFGERNKELLESGAAEVLARRWESRIVAYSVGRREEDVQRAIFVAANFSDKQSRELFKFKPPILAEFGAFRPRADRNYVLKDYADADTNGTPKAYVRSGLDLVNKGLYVSLPAGGVHLFEVEEREGEPPATGPPGAAPRQASLNGTQFSLGRGAPAIAPAEAADRSLGSVAERLLSRAPASLSPETTKADAPAARLSGIAPESGAASARSAVEAPRIFPVDRQAPALPASKPAPISAWDRWTQRMTDSTMFIFTGLQVPQLWSNVVNLTSGHASALSILPWTGYLTGILANMMMLSFFVSLKDKSPARVQAIGVLTSTFVLGQIFMAGFMPAAALLTALPVIAAGLGINYLRWRGALPEKVLGLPAWDGWQKFTALLGLSALPVGFAMSFGLAASLRAAAAYGVAAGGLGLALMLAERWNLGPKALRSAWSSVGAWLATMLFMFGPVAQLINNHNHPAAMAGIAVGTLLLGTLGNLLMLPRAILTKNRIWFIGSSWAVGVGGLAVLATMYAGGFVSAALFWSVAAAVPVFLGYALRQTRKQNGGASVWKSLGFLVGR